MVGPAVSPSANKRWTAHAWREGLALSSAGLAPTFSCATVAGDRPLVGQPPLPIELGADDIERIEQAGAFGAAAASCFGPASQDKLCNEDAAIAAAFTPPRGRAGHPTTMICVADGVGTKTFWSERSSRIACLVTYVTMRDHVLSGRANTPDEIEALRATLCSALVTAFETDRARLLKEGVAPPAWNRATFEKNRHNLGFWYNTTLIVAVMNRQGGFALWAGDGALIRSRRLDGGKDELAQPLRSGPTSQVYNVASLGGPILMNGVRIDAPSGLADLRLALMSDGAEKTSELHTEGLKRWLRPDVCGREKGGALADALLLAARDPRAEGDNHSIATLDWSVLAPARRAPASRPPAAAPEWRPAEWKHAASPAVRRKLAPLTEAQRHDLAILARSKFITTQWLAMFVSARCEDDAAEMEALAAYILTVAPRRKALQREIADAVKKPIENRADIETLVRDIEKLSTLYGSLAKKT